MAQNERKAVSATEDDALVEAVSLFDNGMIDKAMTILSTLVKDNPGNDAAQYYLGCCFLAKNNFEKAQVPLKCAVRLDPGNYWYRERLAQTYLFLGENELTLAAYEDMLRDFPEKDDIHYQLVNLYLRQGQTDKALETMDKIETLFGKNENIAATRYDILLRQDRAEEAIKVLYDFNEEFSSPRILSLIGDYEMSQYKDTSALARYREALEIQSEYTPAVLGEAEVWRIRRNYPEFFATLGKFISSEETLPGLKAQYMDMLVSRSDPWFVRNNLPQIDSLYDKMTAISPDDSTTLSSAAIFNFSTGKQEKAKDLLFRNMKANPNSSEAAKTYIQILGSLQQWDEIKSTCDSSLRRFPANTDFLELKNYACYNLKEYDEVIANYRKILTIAAGDTSKVVPALSGIGDMLFMLGEEKEAFRTYDKLLKIDPGHVPTLNNYAWYLAIGGKKLKKALAMSAKTIEVEPDNSTYLDTFGWILHLLGRDQEAKTHFKRAMLHGGKESAVCLGHYASVLEALGEKDLAEVYRERAAAKEAEGKE